MALRLDMREEVRSALRTAVTKAGLSQADFADYLETSSSRLSTYLSGKTVPAATLYLHAVRIGDAFERAQQLGLMTPNSTAAAVNRALAAGDEDFALRMILQARDDLRLAVAEAPSVVHVWSHRTVRIEDARFDALFRAVIAHELGAQSPEWTRCSRLAPEWVLPDPFRDEAQVRQQTPEWLARAGIFIAERGLATA